MQSALRTTTKVLPGGRVELSAPELREGQDVDVIVLLPADPPTAATGPRTVLDFIDALPAGPRSGDTWDEVEGNLRDERAAWDR